MKDGYILDCVNGSEVRATPEEVQAVQPLCKILMDDYGYPAEVISSHPQYRVKVRPSDTKKEYPVDIAVFKSERKTDDDCYIIGECKKNTRKDGLEQLKDYLRFSKAEIGVWFNGSERAYIRKYYTDGKVEFQTIPNIPKYGQTLADVGKLTKDMLNPAPHLKATFIAIRNQLAANAVGVTRDEVLAQQMINIIFCKIYDENFTAKGESLRFRAEVDEKPEVVKERIIELFKDVKEWNKTVIDKNDSITLDAVSIAYVVGELQNYSLVEAPRDSVADAFEIFIGHALKGGQGQFFTPRNVVRMMVEILDPSPDDYVIDPACGSGGFLEEILRYVFKKIDIKKDEYGWSNDFLGEQRRMAVEYISGIDKDYFLSKVARAYMAIFGFGNSNIYCEDSLENPKHWSAETRNHIALGKYNILLTNPPFGSKIPVTGEEKLGQYDLACKWKTDKKTSSWTKGKLKDSESPQVLFIERDLELLADYGKMGIVLPDGVFGNETFGYIRNWLCTKGRIIGIVDIPVETFQPHTATKTSILFFQKLPKDKIPERYDIFMAIADTCGHDRRGNEIESDDIQKVAAAFHKWESDHPFEEE
jgi:type I restriction enzyme M protein